MSIIRSYVRRILDTPLGDRARDMLRYNPTLFKRPLSSRASVSDLFPWRVDDVWDTRFDVLNLPSLVFPAEGLVDNATVVVYGADGTEIARQTYRLEPFEVRVVMLRDLLREGYSGVGTFACFHDAACATAMARTGSHIMDRQYVAFKRKGDHIWGFAHGNVTGPAKRSGDDAVNSLSVRPLAPRAYRVQCRLDDCERVELVYANYSDREVPMTVRWLDEARNILKSEDKVLPPFGVGVFSAETSDGRVVMAEHVADMAFWRPVIFKHHKTHYNVLHS